METQEVWKSSIAGSVVVQRSMPNGLIRHELIPSGRSFSISPDDRRMNQNICAHADLDPFANGMLQPVSLPEDTEPEVLSNPNHIPDAQLPALFRLQARSFQKRVEMISNTAMLQRLLDIAPGQDATLRQMEVIQARMAEVSPSVNPADIETDEAGFRKVKAVTPH